MSRGLYKSLEEATGTDQVNKELALIAVEQVIYFDLNNRLRSFHVQSYFSLCLF